MITPTQEERFWDKVELTPSCWYWKGAKAKFGYGNFGYNGKSVNAHRLAYELFNGSIPEGKIIDHLCRNPSCVNPKHLEVVTMKENLLRGDSIPAQNARKTHCSRGHEFTLENTRFDKENKRRCKTCAVVYEHTRYLTQRKQMEHN